MVRNVACMTISQITDAMNGKDVTKFAKSVEKKYEGQLALYRYAIGKSFGVSDVNTELIDLYR